MLFPDDHGNPYHTRWLEVPARKHMCYVMDINNPVWREYLKVVVCIHVDAGVDGIQFDEPDSPLAAIQYGGSFFSDNVTGLPASLRVSVEQTPESMRSTLDTFQYGEWLLAWARRPSS
jgi:hypothetical protein